MSGGTKGGAGAASSSRSSSTGTSSSSSSKMHKVAPERERSQGLVDDLKDVDHSHLRGEIDRFKTRTKVFMEYDIQLFDVNREQYRRTRVVLAIIIAFVSAYCALYISAEALCLQMLSGDELHDWDDNCVVEGPMSCFSGLCEGAGLECNLNRECLCPDYAEYCNMSALGAGTQLCDEDNHTFHRRYRDCALKDGLAITDLFLQSVALITIFIFSVLYWHRQVTHRPAENREEVEFFRSVRRYTAALLVLMCLTRICHLVYAVYYTRYGVLNEWWAHVYATHNFTPTWKTAVTENLFQSCVATFGLFAPILLFTRVLEQFPAQMWDTKCHHAVLAVDTTLYLAVRIVFGYAYGQTFGYLPFTYLMSVVQVCSEDPPDAIQVEIEAALRQPRWAGVFTTEPPSPGRMLLDDAGGSDDDDAVTYGYEGGPLQVLRCSEVPTVLWIGVAAVLLWECLLLVQLIYVRHSVEKAILSVAYPQYRAIILYYRFVDALWRLLAYCMLCMGMPMALANPDLWRWTLWDDTDAANASASGLQLVPLKYLGTTLFAGSALDLFFAVWCFGIMYLHLPRFYFGHFLTAFCPNKIARIIASVEGDLNNFGTNFWGLRTSSTRHLSPTPSFHGHPVGSVAGGAGRRAPSRLDSVVGGCDSLGGRKLSTFISAIQRHEDRQKVLGAAGSPGQIVTQASVEDQATLDPRSRPSEQRKLARAKLAPIGPGTHKVHAQAHCASGDSASPAAAAAAAAAAGPLHAPPKGASGASAPTASTATAADGAQEAPSSPAGATRGGTPETEGKTGGGPAAAAATAAAAGSSGHGGGASAATSPHRSATHEEYGAMEFHGGIAEDELPPGGLDCFIDIVYADFVKEIVRIFKKLGYNGTTRGYKTDPAFQGALRKLLGESRYAQYAEDNTTLQVIANRQNKNHCWYLRSVPQEGLVIVFPGSANIENFLNAMNLNTVPWESYDEWQFRTGQLTPQEQEQERCEDAAVFDAADAAAAATAAGSGSADAAAAAVWRAAAARKSRASRGSSLDGLQPRTRPKLMPRRSTKWRKSLTHNMLKEAPCAPADCRVHAGFFSMYKTIRAEVMAGLKEHLAHFPDTAKITVTGHSLGGVLSSFLALDMLESGLVKNLERIHVSLYGSPCVGNLAFKKYYDSLLPATLQFGMWNDPVIMYPPQPCQMVYWHCVGKDVILLPALQYLVEPSQLELYFLQLGHTSNQAHRRFTYYHAVLRLLLDPRSENTISDVSVDELQRYLWSIQLIVRRSPVELTEFYHHHLPEFVEDATACSRGRLKSRDTETAFEDDDPLDNTLG